MNDDDLLFPLDDLENWKHRQLPPDWLSNRKKLLLERLRHLAAEAKSASRRSTSKPKPATPPRR
ncbi:hypothetical protein [Brevundimonas sp. EAKA]|uniref:hypothetical protein n=1 Tax=Brevundimonas sp. EAKA TaxID=1495854 RepID=UPI0012DF731B|nr:hypothetical protein [Brevundimonas sp. EAKA]